MQLCEAFIWHDQNCGEINKFATKGAFIFNITQPIVVFLVCINMFTIDPEIKYLASFIILMYICYMLYSSNKNNEYICTKNSNTCFHLELPWWNNIISSVFYIGTLISISLLIFKPLNTAIAIVMFLLFTLFLSSVFYSCGAPSMWCWLVVPFPIIIGFIDSGLNKNIQ
jgi:hypothetical protein